MPVSAPFAPDSTKGDPRAKAMNQYVCTEEALELVANWRCLTLGVRAVVLLSVRAGLTMRVGC